MRQLVIEYVFEGHQRGYNFTSPTSGYTDDDLKTIWRNAMPRGQGWGQYAAARSLKCFPLDRAVAVCETEVTDLRDENDRGGIRRAVIDVLSHADYVACLQQRLRVMPDYIRARVERLPSFSQRMTIANKTMPKPRRNKQLVIVRPYTVPEDWQLVEGLLIKLALSPVGPMRRWGKIIPFTTLALSHPDELSLVALPAAKGQNLDKRTSVIKL